MMAVFRKEMLVFLACGAIAACSSSSTPVAPIGGGTETARPATPSPVAKPSPSASPTSTATPTATPAPVSNTSAISVNGGGPLSNQPTTVPVPLPTGYTQSINIPLVSAAAGTNVTVTAGTAVPAGLVPLRKSRGRLPFGLGRFDTTGAYDTIFYESFEPTASITVAGSISADQAFPAGTLNSSTSYYLAFYDTSASSPAWQTIAGPVSPSGNTLTFSGTVSSTTLSANTLYGFAIFSSASPTSTPPPAPATLLYFGNGNGLTIATESGTVVNTLAIPSGSFDLDDAGNVYAAYAPYANGSFGPATLMKYPAGSASPSATYALSATDLGFVAASGAGQVAYFHGIEANTPTETTDVWDPGATGAPSRTITTKPFSSIGFFGAAHDGTLYLADTSASGTPQFDVFAPGASTPTSIIPETIIPASQYQYYSPNYSAVGPDGTLYVTQYSFEQPDPIAGTYVYPPGGAERFIPAAADANGPGPQGVDVDGSGNIYVVNDNYGFNASGTCQNDSLGTISEYNSAGTLVQTDTGALGGVPLTTTADGTNFLSAFVYCSNASSTATPNPAEGIYSILPGATTSTPISTAGSTEIVLYDGTHKTAPFNTSARGVSHGYGGFGRAFLRRHLRQRK